MDANLLKARSYYYEFFAIPFFFYETDTKFKRWKEQLEFLRSSLIVPSDEADIEKLAKAKNKTVSNNSCMFFAPPTPPIFARASIMHSTPLLPLTLTTL